MSFVDKLTKLEQEKNKLVEKRLLEIAKLAEKAGVIGLDNKLIIGAYLYALEAYHAKNQKIIDDLTSRAKIFPSRRRSISKKIDTTMQGTYLAMSQTLSHRDSESQTLSHSLSTKSQTNIPPLGEINDYDPQ